MRCGVSIPRMGEAVNAVVPAHAHDMGLVEPIRIGGARLQAETFGERLRRLRQRAGYRTQPELAAAFGIWPQSISNWETHTAEPRLGHMLRLCRLLGVSLDYLCLGTDQPNWLARSMNSAVTPPRAALGPAPGAAFARTSPGAGSHTAVPRARRRGHK